MSDLITVMAGAAGAGGAAETDEYFNQTTLLLHGDGTNGAQNNTFLDSSTNNFTITRNGNTTQGTFSPFSVGAGEWSNYFDGSGDYFTTPYSTTNFDWFTSGTDFTFEAWIYPTTFTGWSYNAGAGDFGTLIGNVTPASSTNYWSFGPIPGGTVRFFYFNGGTVTVTSTEACVLNQWNHIAFTKTSSGITIFVNGVGTTASAISGTPQSSTGVTLTIGSGNGSSINGYVSNLRIVKGTAVYSGTTYTVPTSPLTAIANTKLLISQSNRFVDNSSVANVLTIAGNTSVQPFSPFAPSAAYSPSVNGGSGYFDGSGDYLSVADDAALTLSGNFTIECLIYPTSVSSTNSIIAKYTPSNQEFLLWVNAGTIAFYFAPYSVAVPLLSSAVSTRINEWSHIAVVRSGNSFVMYVNGVSVSTATDSGSFTDTGSPLEIGYLSGYAGYDFDGYISNVRLVKGTAVYTSAFTPPTAPLTAVSGTELLCNFTNAGIFDNTGKNNLETVADAQIDTTTKKWGTGSLEFDGTGDYLKGVPSDFFKFSGDFTIEAWVYINSYSNPGILFDTRTGGSSASGTSFQVTNTGALTSYTNSTIFTGSAGDVPLTTWTHIAMVRSGSTITAYANGVSKATATASTNYSDGLCFIGTNSTGTVFWNGYIDDLRITKGVARYTTTFTPPTKAFPDL